MRCVLICALVCGAAPARAARARTPAKPDAAADAERDRRLKWFREARFGLFIHWGLYAVPAGEWEGKLVPGLGEWIMNRAKIPVAEYEQLTKQFDPVEFDADAWVRLARDAGMKYLVITSKHHDGFAMYHSKVSRYNITDATPFRRDPLKELAEACRKYGVRLGFYYSQTQDWHERDAVGNDWDWPADRKRDFRRYLDEKVKPQVTELLTGYGPIALVWFDTPRDITREQSKELVDLVHKLQPDCLVSGRVGHGLGDYDSAGDNQISVGQVRRDWETPVTMNDTWGFKRDDQNWKPTGILIRQLVQVSSRGGNYLLNVGPTAGGRIPPQSVERLAQVGRWLKSNSESVYGARPSPYPYELPWGIITTKPGRVYLHVFEWPRGELVLYGLRSKVRKAYLLPDRTNLKFTQRSDAALGHEALTLRLPPSAPDAYDSVVALEVAGGPQVDTTLTQQPDGAITLPAHLSEVHRGAAAGGEGLRFDTRGVAERWTNRDEWLSWDFRVVRPGEYDVLVVTSEQKYGRDWEGGHRLEIDAAGQRLSGKVERDGKEVDPANPYWPYVVSRLGRLRVDRAGRYGLTLKPQTLNSEKKLGLTLVSVRLVPAGGQPVRR